MRNSVIKNVNAKLYFLYRKSAFFGTNERQLLCSALVNPRFECVCNAWYRSVHAKVKHKLQTAQSKMIRYLLNYGCRRHIGFKDFKKSNCLDLNARVSMWLWIWCSLFLIMWLLLTCVTLIESHSVTTLGKVTQRWTYVVPRAKGQGPKSFKYNGSKLRNELPMNVKHAQQKIRFKK